MAKVDRHWIHPYSEKTKSEDDFLFAAETGQESFVQRVFANSTPLSWPVISLGFVSIVFLSFMFTYAYVTLFSETLELAPNENISRLEVSVATNERPEASYFHSKEVKRVATPRVDVNTSDMPVGQDFAHVDDGPARMTEIKVFSGGKVTSVKVPAAKLVPVSGLDEDIISRERSLRHDAVPLSLAPNDRSFASALGIAAPVAIIDLPPRVASADGLLDAPSQKLLPKRFAFAVSAPVFDMQAGETPSGFREAAMDEAPSEILSLKARSIDTVESRQEIPGQKLMPRRFAKLVDAPVRVEETPILAKPEPRIVLPAQPAGENLEAWRKYAASVPAGAEGKPKIVIIIDDMGNNPKMAQLMSELEGPLNFAFLPYAPGVKGQTRKIRNAGHELLVHMPMEPTGEENPGPRALRVDLPVGELQANLEWNLTRFEGFVGINNHMGSRFTKDGEGMAMVMAELKSRGLLFLDSVTTGASKGASLARQEGLPWAGRDVFLDNEINEDAILAQLMKVEQIAKSKGLVIAIGHPHGATYRALKAWIPTLEDKGFVLVPVSSIVKFHGTRKLAVNAGIELASD